MVNRSSTASVLELAEPEGRPSRHPNLFRSVRFLNEVLRKPDASYLKEVNGVQRINRVIYDYTATLPGTMEWE